MIDPTDRDARPPCKPLELKRGDVAVLCEGRDDIALVKHVAKQIGLTQIVPGMKPDEDDYGFEDEAKALATQALQGGAKAIGFVFDAEQSRKAAEKRIHKMIRAAYLPVPGGPLALVGAEIGGDAIEVAYIINPHGRDTGCLESLFMPQVKIHSLWPCVGALVDCYVAGLESQGVKKTAAWRSKVAVRTFIAHACPSNTGLQSAFHAKLLNCDGPEFEPIREFLRLLCA